mmetsp:Transcript_28367/g.84933  ORF Transcript_28367/g.84933 Transcript_28367/m.84933 type:complete len:198 (-) Transcript_28367:15-608(-)
MRGRRLLLATLSTTTSLAPPRVGSVLVRNTQRTIPVDTAALESYTRHLLQTLGCGDFDVGLWLTTDATVRKLNTQFRGIRKSTDILSFPFHDELAPGEAATLPRDDEDLLNLGDMVVSLPYVKRRAEADAGAPEEGRGVACAMAPERSVDARVQLLVIHGLCHLLNYDHETDEDFEEMVAKEEELLEARRAWLAAKR